MHAILIPAVTKLSTLSPSLLVIFGLLAAVEVGLDIVALVDLYRRPTDRVLLENKWLWVAIILLINLIGAIVYLAVGRKSAPAADTATTSSQPARTKDIVDSLYGSADHRHQP